MTTLPVLDFSQFTDPDSRDAFLAQLRHAAHDVGFFYLINHGVDRALQDAVQAEARKFFALPDAHKQQVAMIHSPHFRGYNRAASELTRGQPDWREQFDIGAERPALELTQNSPRWRRLQGPNLWPHTLPTLRPALLAWQDAMTEMALSLLRAFAQALHLPADAFDSLYGEQPNEHIKLIRYPGQQDTQSTQGVGAHKDSGFLSFLLQDAQKGLQVEVAPNHWIDADRCPAVLWSISVSCLSLRPTATCAPPCTAWCHRLPDRSACRSPFSSARSSTPWCRCMPCRRRWRRKPTDRKAIRRIRYCATWAGIT